MQYFVCSDTHGFHLEFLLDLMKSGFDIDNPNHKLIVCGDISDGGAFFKEHLLYLYDLYKKDKAIILHGNHDYILIGFLKNLYSYDHFLNDGLKETLSSLLDYQFSFDIFKRKFPNKGNAEVFSIWQSIVSNKIKKKYPFLLEFLGNLPHYFETEHYIFTHGAVDYNCSDWHNPSIQGYKCSGWVALHFIGPNYYRNFINRTNKKIVVGHLNADLMRFTLEGVLSDSICQQNSIYYNESINVYFLDTLTQYSKRVNFLVLNEEELG